MSSTISNLPSEISFFKNHEHFERGCAACEYIKESPFMNMLRSCININAVHTRLESLAQTIFGEIRQAHAHNRNSIEMSLAKAENIYTLELMEWALKRKLKIDVSIQATHSQEDCVLLFDKINLSWSTTQTSRNKP